MKYEFLEKKNLYDVIPFEFILFSNLSVWECMRQKYWMMYIYRTLQKNKIIIFRFIK